MVALRDLTYLNPAGEWEEEGICGTEMLEEEQGQLVLKPCRHKLSSGCCRAGVWG